MDDKALMEALRSEYPGAFLGWDGFEVSVQVRNRKGKKPQGLVILYNESKTGMVVDRHICFLVSSDEDGEDVVEIGAALNEKFDAAYYPGE